MELLGVLILLVLVLGSVLLVTRGVFARDLTNALKRVTQQEQALQEKADILEQRISQMERDHQMRLKSAEADAERIVQEAKRQAMELRQAATEEGKLRARQLLLEAEQGRSRIKAELANELNSQAIRRACDILRASLPAEALGTLHHALVTELLDTLKRLDLGSSRGALERVAVVTAQALSPSAAEQLRRWASALLGDAPIEVETDPALVAGCIVRLGATTLDGSLATRLEERTAA